MIFLYLILSIVVVEFVLERVIAFLNFKTIGKPVPDELKGVYSPEEYSRSMLYQKEEARLSLISATLFFFLTIIFFASGMLGQLDMWLNQFTDNKVLDALAFFGIMYLASDILHLPFQWYGIFVIEEKYGFNKTTQKLFWIDKLKGYALAIILGGALMGALLWLIIVIGSSFWIWFWLVMAGFILLANIFYTSLILPLFNKLEPLADGELKKAIQDYAHKVNFSLDKVFIMDGSKRSSKANAFFSGLGSKKKIVLYDTLVKDFTTEEVIAVLAHETGHFKHKHIISGLAWSILQIGVILYLLSTMIFMPELSSSLGYQGLSIGLNLVAFGVIFSPISTILGLLMNFLSRKHEYEADHFATTTYHGNHLSSALKKLSVTNLSNLTPHAWYVFFYYSHPPLLHRVKAIESPNN